jgi:hypothetical protein
MPDRVTRSALRVVGQVLGSVLFVLGGAAACGALWAHWWTPPTGVAMNGAFVLDEKGLAQDFSGTGLYVAVALCGGAVIGLLVGLLIRGQEVLTVAVVLVAAGVGAWVMLRVGQALGPPDPSIAAGSAADLTKLVPQLVVRGVGPLLSLPAGTMCGLAAAFLIREAIGVIRPQRGRHVGNLVV